MRETPFSVETFELPRNFGTLNPVSFRTSAGRRGWCVRLPGHHRLATPAVAGDLVLLGGGFGSYEFYAFDADTGQMRWRQRTRDDGPTAAVAYEDLVAFNTESCTLIVCEATTGRERWSKWLGDPLMSQPAIARANGRAAVVMVYPERNGNHQIAAFDLREGHPLWKTALAMDVISAPVVVSGTVYATLMNGTIVELDAGTGKLKRQDPEARATSAPWVVGDELFYSQREDRPRQPNKPTHGGEEEDVELYEALACRGSEGTELWREVRYAKKAFYLKGKATTPKGQALAAFLKEKDAGVGFSVAPHTAKLFAAAKHLGYTAGTVAGAWGYQGSRPVVVDDIVYSAVGTCVRAEGREDRTVLWELELAQEELDCRSLAPVAVAGRCVFTVTSDGVVVAIDRQHGTVLWAVKLPTGWVEYQPAIERSQLFVATADGLLFCLDAQDPTATGWPMWGGGPGHNGDAPLCA